MYSNLDQSHKAPSRNSAGYPTECPGVLFLVHHTLKVQNVKLCGTKFETAETGVPESVFLFSPVGISYHRHTFWGRALLGMLNVKVGLAGSR